MDGTVIGLLLAPGWGGQTSRSSSQIRLTQQILCVTLRDLTQGGPEDPEPPVGRWRSRGIPHRFRVWGVGSSELNSRGFHLEVMDVLNNCVLSGEQACSQRASHSL